MSAVTSQPTNNANEAQFLAPEPAQNAGASKPKPKLRIAEFRSAVDSLNWSRNDLSGATREEFARMDVPTRLQRRINEVVDLLLRVSPRFVEDIRHARASIASAEATIERWRAARATAIAEFDKLPLELNLSRLPVPVRCAVEWMGTLPSAERTHERLASVLAHYLATYGLSEDPRCTYFLASAWAIAQRLYRIEAPVAVAAVEGA